MRKKRLIYVLLFFVVVLSSCAAGSNPEIGTAAAEGEPAGFGLGVWHGFIVMFTFIVSLFDETVNIYEVHNNGMWYNFGFFLGLTLLQGSGRSSD